MLIFHSVISDELHLKCTNELESLLKTNCWVSSASIWQERAMIGVSGSCISTLITPPLHHLIEDEIKNYLPDYNRITCCFYVWERNSGIAFHGDEKYLFDATIYLNHEWNPDFGGALVWEDANTINSGVYKCVFPSKGMMALNNNKLKHQVSMVSPNATEPRMTIQISGY